MFDIMLWNSMTMPRAKLRRRSAPLLTAALIGISAVLGVSCTAKAAELVMFEREGCKWCRAWDRDISEIYPRTQEGKRAPLRRVDLDAERPSDLRAIKGVRYTPTFVLIDKGREVGRIAGYPGEAFFWGLLGELLERLPRDQASLRDSGFQAKDR
jgi:thioredoxin-related protein